MSLFIKVATAGLTYGMYVLLSRVMVVTEYGYFAFGLSLATILAIGANFGQQTAILCYWPEAMVAITVSLPSTKLSLSGVTVIVLAVSPGAKVTVLAMVV